MVKGENTGYMEPYEAQRIMTGKKRKLHMEDLAAWQFTWISQLL